jgi:hypothetical protein
MPRHHAASKRRGREGRRESAGSAAPGVRGRDLADSVMASLPGQLAGLRVIPEAGAR